MGNFFQISACSSPQCLPKCSVGYLCQHGQCTLDPNDGRSRAITCKDACKKLDTCHLGDPIKCTAQCQDITTIEGEKKDYLLRYYECFLAASCFDVREYLNASGKNFLWQCIGCREDSDCQGGYLCNAEQKKCRTSCMRPTDCKQGFRCDLGKCKKG